MQPDYHTLNSMELTDSSDSDPDALPASVQRALLSREAINVTTDRFVYVFTHLLEACYRSPSSKPDAKHEYTSRTTLLPCMWSAVDPMRALVRVASLVNTYNIVAKRDLFADDALGYAGRFHTLDHYTFNLFANIQQQYENIMDRHSDSALHPFLRPVCYLADDHHVGVRRLVRNHDRASTVLYTIETEFVYFDDATRAHNALYRILRDDVPFSVLWNRVVPRIETQRMWTLAPLWRSHTTSPSLGSTHAFRRRPSI